MDQTKNRSFYAYLVAKFKKNVFYDKDTANDTRLYLLKEWWDEIEAFIDDAKKELPENHTGGPRFDTVKKMIKKTLKGIAEGVRQLPTAIVHQADVAWEPLNAIPKVPNAPKDHALEWGSTTDWIYVFVHKDSPGLDVIDVKYLYEAMRDQNKQHQTSKAKNAPEGTLWYTHDYGRNRLLAVAAYSANSNTVEVSREGTVSQGVHRF